MPGFLSFSLLAKPHRAAIGEDRSAGLSGVFDGTTWDWRPLALALRSVVRVIPN